MSDNIYFYYGFSYGNKEEVYEENEEKNTRREEHVR